MSEYIVRTSNVEEIEKYAIIIYKSKLMDIVFIETKLAQEEVLKIDGVYHLELNDTFGCLFG